MTFPTYTPGNWYWIVGGSSSQVYSSAVNNFVPVSDAAYSAWLAVGNTPTKIDTIQNLADVLDAAGKSLPPSTQISDAQRQKLFDAVPRAVQLWAFDIDNRVRALEGQPARTPNQFRSYVKNLF